MIVSDLIMNQIEFIEEFGDLEPLPFIGLRKLIVALMGPTDVFKTYNDMVRFARINLSPYVNHPWCIVEDRVYKWVQSGEEAVVFSNLEDYNLIRLMYSI